VAADAYGRRVTDPATDIDVLLVDDQELFRAGVAVIVDAQDGMRVVGQAGDGLEAIRLVEELAPDVVLMDLRMPELDGVEATRQIFAPERVARRAKPVRVLVLTTFNLDDRAATAIRYGASGFLLKDTTPVMLRDAIRTVHSGNAVLAPQDLALLLDGDFRSRSPVPSAYESLTDKEQEVFTAVARGLSNAEIAALVFAGESTVKTHVGSILRKLGLRDRVQIVVFAHDHGLVQGS
jgi:DNA-binding NarL/FixJ family response regulator